MNRKTVRILSLFAVLAIVLLYFPDTAMARGKGIIGDRVWDDINGNGIQDPGEPGIDGVGVKLCDCDHVVLASTTTANGGYYSFGGVDAGCYIVSFEPPSGRDFTAPNQGDNDNRDSDADPVTGESHPFHLGPDDTNSSIDAGLRDKSQLKGTIGDRVWLDQDGDSLQDTGEPGLANVVVELYSGPNLVDIDTTDNSGHYLFTGLNADDYQVQVVPSTLPTGLTQTFDKDGSLDNQANVGLGAGETALDVDFGYKPNTPPTAKIGNKVWEDLNQNGKRNSNESGVPGVRVDLLAGCFDMTVLATKVTDSTGWYSFKRLPAGQYRIRVTLPDGFVFSPQNQGNNDANDSDVDVNNGISDCINLADDENDPTNDAAIYRSSPQLGSIGDRVFNDTNQDGIQDAGEPGVPGVTVQLKDCNGNVLQSTTTDGNGNYLFANLDAGCYSIGVVTPGGFVISPADQGGNDANDSDVDPNTAMSGPIDLAPGENDPTNDAGIYQPAPQLGSIGDRVFNDTDQDGIQDAGEPGVPGVTVQLKDCNGNVLQSTTTDGNGNYLFDNLDAGCYSIGVVLPDGRSFSPQDQGGNDATDSDIDPSNAMSSQFNLALGEDNPTIDAGLVAAVCGLELTHTCQVATPPSGNLACDSKVAAATFRYVGPSVNGATVVFTGKDGQASYNVDLISGETVLTGQNGFSIDARPKDLGSKMQASINGSSEGNGFHTSCSVPFVVGQPAPLNDPKGAPSSNWIVEAFVQKDGRTVTLPSPGPASNQCVITPGSGDVCSGKNKPDSFTLRYTGGSCAASNNAQGSKFECGGGDPSPGGDPNATITVSSKKGGSQTVQLGDEFTLDKDGLKELTLSGIGGSQSLEIHTSCSAPIRLGDVYGALTLVGADGQRLDTQVTLTYLVSNIGNDLSNVSIQDDLVGSVAGPFTLLSGLSEAFEETITIEEAITNRAIAQGNLAPGTMCTAEDTVTIEIEERLSGLSCSDGKPQQLVFEYTGESCSASSNSQGSKFDCSGTPNGGTASVSILKDANKINVSPSTVSVGDSLTVSSSEGKKLKSRLQLNVGGQTLDIHTSCSAPLAVGDQFGSLLLTQFFPEGSVQSAARLLSPSQITDTLFLPFTTNH